MSRYTRNTVIQAQITATPVIPTFVATDAILMTEMPDHEITREYVDRALLRGYMGGSDQLVKARNADFRYKCEFWGSGDADTPPAWGRLLRMCGMAETIVGTSHVAYAPVSTGQEMGAIRFVQDGIAYASKGGRGSVKFNLVSGDRPTMEFNMMGFDTGAATGSVGAYAYADWIRPDLIIDSTAGDIRLGSTYNAGTGAISGGTPLVSRGLEIDLGNKLSYIQLLGGDAIDIVDREVTGKMTVALSAAEEVTWRSDMNANATTSLSFTYGTVAGQRITVFAPKVQRIAPKRVDYEGRVLFETELRFLPSVGNDELLIVSR